MNPMQLLQIKNGKEEFCRNHPKFPLFLETLSKNALQEGTIVEFQVNTPNDKSYNSNLRLTASDIDFIKLLMEQKA